METLQFRTDAFKKELEYEEYFTVHRQAKLKSMEWLNMDQSQQTYVRIFDTSFWHITLHLLWAIGSLYYVQLITYGWSSYKPGAYNDVCQPPVFLLLT